jgi:hypothetical protein
MQQAYVYKWIHKPTMNWYVGSRTSKNCHPNDGYICSSKTVKPLILNNPLDWERQVIFVGCVEEARVLETEILTLFDAKNDSRSFNKHNQDKKFICTGHSEETKAKILKNHAWKGKKRPDHSQKMKGRIVSKEAIQKVADQLRGRKFTLAHRNALKIAKSTMIYITPAGEFSSSRDAGFANGISKTQVTHNCRGFFSKLRKKWYPPKEGWAIIERLAA